MGRCPRPRAVALRVPARVSSPAANAASLALASGSWWSGHVHTQTIEGFFGLTKNGIPGVYHAVSKKWLQGYLNEYAWRYNRRDSDRSMFKELLAEAVNKAV